MLATQVLTGSVADGRKTHAASTLYHTAKRVVTKAFGHVELAFDDLLDQLQAGDDPTGVEEMLEPKHRSHPRLDTPVVLLHDVVQVGTISESGRIVESGN